MSKDQLLKYRIEGQLRADETLVFIHGWPDDSEIWSEQIDRFSHQYRCLLIDLPNFGGGRPQFPWGLDLDVLEQMIWNTVDHALREAPVPQKKPTLMAHDWGAFFGWRMLGTRPDFFARAVCIDISPSQSTKLFTIVFGIIYQWSLIGAFLVGRLPVVGILGDMFAKVAGRILGSPTAASKINSSMGFLYLKVWMSLLSGGKLGGGALYPKKIDPESPVFYAWGGKKPVQFHSEQFLQKFHKGRWAELGFREKEFPRGDHWLHRRRRTCEEFNNDVEDFFAQTRSRL